MGASRAKVVLAASLMAVGLAAVVFLPVGAWLVRGLESLREAGTPGAFAFIAVYILCAVFFVPGSLLTLGAGAVYGVLRGTALVSVASVLGAFAAFLLGRTLLRDWVSERLRSRPQLGAFDAAIARDGFRTVLLLRLSPILPFNFLNYALGLTQVSLRDFVLGSWLGMLPGTLLYVWLGSLASSVAELLSGRRPALGFWGQVLFGVGLIATAWVSWTVHRRAKAMLAAGTGGSEQ